MCDTTASRTVLSRVAIEIDSQKTLLPYLPLDIENFEAFRVGHPLGRVTNLIQVHRRRHQAGCQKWPSLGRKSSCPAISVRNKKVGSRPLCRSTLRETPDYSDCPT